MNLSTRKMVPMDRSFSVLLGTHPAPMIRTLTLAEGLSFQHISLPIGSLLIHRVWYL